MFETTTQTCCFSYQKKGLYKVFTLSGSIPKDSICLHVSLIFMVNVGKYTPLKFNMEPEQKSLEKVIPFGNHHFQVTC